MRHFVFFIVLILAFPASSKPKAYFDVNDSLFSSPRLVIDNKVHTPGFFGFSGIAEAMSSDPKAYELARDYRLYANWAQGFIWTGLIAAFIYAQSTISDDSQSFNSGTYLGIFGIGFIPGLILTSRSNTKLIRAVNQFNGVYSADETAAWQITPASKGLGLAIHF